jgi:zinc transport system substrate-binding protein
MAPVGSMETLSVYTVSYPLQYFAERIGGAHVNVTFPAPRDVDPASWSPEADTVSAYQRADVILLNGANYAKWVATATIPASKLVDTSLGFADRYITVEDAVVHSHGPEGEHSHGETAFTTWLDPTLALEQAAAIRDALVAARPEHESDFHEGFAELEADLAAVDRRIEAAIVGGADVVLVGSRPVYQYFARRYGVSIPSVHFEPTTYPDDDAWHDLEHLLEDHPAKWMIWEADPIARTAERLLEMGIDSAVVAPGAGRPGVGDYLSVMEANAAAIEKVFSSP